VTDAAPGNIVYGTLQGTISPADGVPDGDRRAMVEATAEAVHPGTLTAADVRMIVAQVV